MLQTISQPIKVGLGVQADAGNVDSESRPWVRVRLSSNDLDVERIVGNWSASGQASRNVAMAVRLLDALLLGDLDAARLACPILNLILPKPENAATKNRPPLRSSDSDSERSKTIRIEDLEEGGQEIARALAEVTGMDLELEEKPIARLALKLARCKNQYTASDVRRWYTSVWKAHWPGSTGDPCDLSNVEKGIGRVRALPPEVPTTTTPEQRQESSRYVEDEYFRRDRPVFNESDLQRSDPIPELTTGRGYDIWLMYINQLRMQINGSTYDTWMRHTRLVGLKERGDTHCFQLTVPHQYAKDWIEKHLKASMLRALHRLHCEGPGARCKAVEVEIQVDGAL